MAHSHAHFCGSFTCPVCMIGFTSALDMEQHWVQEHSFGEELNVRRVEELDSNDGISVPQDIIDSQCHTFRIKSYRHPRNCDLCKQIIWSDAVQCRVCKYACHKKCESKVMTTCVPPVNYELPSNERLAKHGYLRMQTNPTVQKDVMTHPQQKLPSRRENEDSVQLDIIYITDRIIALSFPASGHELLYRNNLKDAARTLKNRHQEKYLVINLSKKRCDLVKLNNQVLDLGWPDHLAPPLEKLCSTCKAIESWLSMDPHNVVVLHTKGGLGRLGVVIAAYMQYIIICNGNGNQNTERFNLKRFFDEKLFSATESSQMRYVNYFSGLLSGAIQINNAPLYLHYLVLHGVPNFDAKGGCQPFFKIYQSMQPSFTSGVYTLTNNMGKLGVVIDPPLQIRGDVLVKCYHRSQANSRDVVFRCQFHTCAISQYHLAFTKYELDDASKDSRFPDYCKLELIFSDTAEKLQGLEGIVNPHVPVDHSDTALMKWDSYENFDKHEEDSEHEADFNESDGRGEVQVIHTHGPVDGSLYAQIPKKGGKHNIPNGPETHRHGGPGMTLELDQEVNDFMDGLKIENNQNGPGPQSKSLVPVQSPTETIKRRVHKEGPKPNTLKTWFSRQQPNTTWNYTHRTLDRNKHANSLDDQISQPPSLEKTKQQQNHTSPQASGNFSQDNRNYPREHSYRGFRDDENPYAEIQDYPHSSPTSSMTSGPPQTSSFSSLSEVTNPTYGASSQSSGKMINNVSPTERDFAMHGYSNVDGQIPNQYRSDQSYGAPGQTEHHSGHSGNFHRTEQIGPIEHTHRVQGQLPDHVQHHSSHDHSTNIQHMHHQGQTTDGQHGKHLVGVHHHHRPGQVTDLQHVGQPGHSTQGQGHSNQHATGQHITHPGQHISGQHVIHTVQSTPGQQSDHHNISDQHLGHHVQSSPGHQTAHSVQHPSGQQVIHPSGHDIHTLQYTTTNERTSPAVATGNNHTRHPTKPAFSMDQTLNSDSEVYPYHLHPPGAEVGSPGHVTSVSPGYNTENAQTTRVVQVHSSSDHNQPIGVIDVHHLANQSSPASSSGVHPLQSQLAATNPPAVGSQRPNINNSQYGMHTKYEIKHQHQPEHIASGQHSPSKQYDQISPQRVIEPQKMSQQAMYQQQKQQLEGHPQQEPAKSHTTDDNLTWLEKQKKKLEEKRQQKNSPPLEDSQRQHYATLTDKSHYPIVSTSQPAGHQHQTVTYTYTEEQHKPMTSQNSNPSDSFKTQVRPSESKLTSQGNLQSPSNVNFDDINLDDLEALALSLQDSTMQLSPGNSYNGGPTSPSLVHPWGKQSTTTTTTTWHNQNRPGMQPTPKRSEGTNNSTRPYSPYEMNTNVTKLPPPSPRLGRTDSGRVCTPTSMDSTVPNRELQIAEEQVVSNPYNGLLFSQPRTIQPVEAPVTASPFHGRLFSAPPPSSSPQNISPRGGYLPAFSESTSQHSTLLSDRSSHQHKSQPADDIVSAKTQQEEPNLTGLVRNRVAGYHAQLIREELEYERGRQPERQPPTHPVQRSKSAGGYDSQSAYNRYAPKREEVPRRRARSPSFEMLITNPGGQPKYESEYWDKRSGLKSPETVQDDEDITGTTPQFPVTPSMVPRTPYANMVTTPIAVVERKAPLNSTADTTNYFPTSKQEPTNQHARHNVFMYPATSTQDRLPNTARGYEQSLPGNAPGNDGSSTEVQYRHQMREGEPLETVINGGPLHEHSSSKQPNGQPYMMTWDQRAALNNKDQEQPMRELYIETQTYEKKVMPGGAPVPTLNIAEQQSLPRQLQHMEAPKQQQHSPGYQNYPTISAAEPNQIASQGLVSYQPQISQQDPSKGVVGGHNALPHGTVMHVHMQKTTHEHVDSAPRSLSTQKPHHEHGSPAQPEHFTVSPHHEHGRPGHVQQEHLNILPHNEHGSPGHTRQEHFTTLHIDEDTSTCTPSDSSASPQQNNSGVAYEQATLPFPTSNSMMKERMQLHKQQEQEQQQEPQQLHAPHQSPQNIYPTYSDRSRPQQQMPKGRGSAPNHQPGYTTFSDRSKGPDQRNPTGHGNITLTTVEQNTTYNTLYDNRGNAADQQKSPNMTQIGSGGSGENIIGVLGSTSRKMVSPGSSHGRGSLTGSERSISPQPPGSGGGIVRSYTNGSINDSGRSSPASLYYHPMSSRGSGFSLGDSDIIHKHPMFVKDISGYWYKPTIARDEAIAILKERPPGSFIVRDSNSFPGAFGLALKVATPPPSVMQNKKNGDLSNELVRHFLIEPNSHGVRLKGCSNEPTFSSLSALVYQHSITPLALPCKLLLPEVDPSGPSSAASSPRSSDIPHSPSALLAQGAACNVLYLHSEEMESLTGPNAVRKAMTAVALKKPRPKTTVVHFKVNYQGITLTDNEKKLFFRRHYAVNNVTYCGMDPENRRWPRTEDSTVADAKIFGFVARKPGSLTDNLCHLFCEHEPEQPASAIVNFVTKIMLGSSQQHK